MSYAVFESPKGLQFCILIQYNIYYLLDLVAALFTFVGHLDFRCYATSSVQRARVGPAPCEVTL